MSKSPSNESSTRKALNLMEHLHRQEKLLSRQYLDLYIAITSHGSFTYHTEIWSSPVFDPNGIPPTSYKKEVVRKAGFMWMGTFAHEENDTRYIIFGDPRNESWHKVIVYPDNQVVLK